MAWGSTFKTMIARRTVTVSYYVSKIAIFGPGAEVDTPGGATGIALSSMNAYIPTSHIRGIDPLSVQFSTEAVDLRTGTYSGGEFRFEFIWASASDRADFYNTCTRGSPIHLALAIDGAAPIDGETLRIGVIGDISEQGRRITVRCYDLLTLLHVRIVKASWPVLFASVDDAALATTIATDYTAGDATIYVSDVSVFVKDDAASYYLVEITPDSGDPFYVKATGTATGPDRLTGATGAQFGTTANDAAAGKAVRSVGLVEGTPFELARKVLQSTGDPGYNGVDDDLPESWGYGIDQAWVDDTDMSAWEPYVAPATGAHAWSWVVTTGTENGLGDLLELFGRAGMWLCNRQGQITARAFQDLHDSPKVTAFNITERDIIEVGSTLMARDSEQPFEVAQVKVTTSTPPAGFYPGGGPSNNRTWPIDRYFDADLSSVIWTNETAQQDAYGARLKPWFCSIPERFRVRVAGLKWMQLCCGDVVTITAAALRGFLLSDADGCAGDVYYMVAAIRWGLPAPWVDLDLVTTPADTSDERG